MRRKAMGDDRIVQLELPILWPDADGILALPQRSAKPPNGSRLRRLQLSPRMVVRAASRYLSSRSFSWWRWWRSSGEDGFIGVSESRFEAWLMDILQGEAFSALEVRMVVERAVDDLELERGDAVRLLLRVTRIGGLYKSVDGLVSFR